MSILIITEAISFICFILPADQSDDSVFIALIIIIDIFYPSGADPTYQLISPHRLRCSSFAVVHYSFMGYFLAAATLMLEWGGSDRE
jgi:hypothetical protein